MFSQLNPVCCMLQFGFLQYEKEEGKKLFFHMTEVHEGASLRVGDEVEFVLVYNQRTNKHSACSVRKLRYVQHRGRKFIEITISKARPTMF
jgi:cold shock CspA family protein